jgi:exonuclease SbcC
MRLTRIRARGLTVFRHQVDIDLSALGPGLGALVGPNGAGKSSILEAVPGALWDAFPSRPGFYEWFHGRDAYIELTFDDLTIRVQVDAEGRKKDRYIHKGGVSLTTGRAAEFEREIAARFGSYDLFLAGAFASQAKAGNFLVLPRGQRKALFAELLGLGRLEQIQAAAHDRAAAAEVALSLHRQRLEEISRHAAGLKAAEDELAGLVESRDVQGYVVERLRDAEATAVATLEKVRAGIERRGHLDRALQSATRELRGAEAAQRDAEDVGRAGLKAINDRLTHLRARDFDADERSLRERNRAAAGAVIERRAAAEALAAQLPDAEAAVASLAGLEREAEALADAEIREVGARGGRHLAEERLAAAERRLQDEEGRAARERDRLSGTAALLDRVPCITLPEIASECPLLADANAARDQMRTNPPGAAAPFRAFVDEARAAVALAVQNHTTAKKAINPERAFEVRQEIARLRAIAAKVEPAKAAAGQLVAMDVELHRLGDALSDDLRRLDLARTDAAAQTVRALDDRKEAEAADRKRVAAAVEAVKAARDRVGQADADLQAAREELGTLTVSQAEASLSEARTKRMIAERRSQDLERDIGKLEGDVARLRETGASLDAIREAVATAESDLGDWKVLDEAFGRSGIQALEIAAAGPEIAALTNDLLEACYGTRFTVSFETLRQKRDGEMAESFDVKVLDRGQERVVEGLSGGERVIVGEAIGLAISVFNSRKSGVQWRTLFRDETAGALDPVHAVAYVDMLRRALALGGFEQLLFIAHGREVWERADFRLFVENGRVSIGGTS